MGRAASSSHIARPNNRAGCVVPAEAKLWWRPSWRRRELVEAELAETELAEAELAAAELVEAELRSW